ncbi:uncharacterized protein LOC112455675 [Temnothorax curvispinosus]|uniref:Uncharacterized protein LOC112455675 n=1 Tax=Temnothorax curvispinosus TaxID=300111 RepID=A0A6J1PUH3_9HYME|nr:uncharacterized protein LOC112455675 [Temnothorax curvispinosus]
MSVKRRVFSALDGLVKCDRAIVCSVFLWHLAFLLCIEAAKPGICAMNGCNCTVMAHTWINIKCVFSKEQSVELLEGTIPSNATELEVSHCQELRIQAGAFGGGAPLKRVHVSGINNVVAKTQAFQNLSTPNTHLEVSECDSVFLESHAFRNTRGTLSVSISRCKHVEIKPNAFTWLLWLKMRDVPSLELSSNAFKLEAPQPGRHGPATKITFQNVRIAELPTAVFPSAIAEIRMDDISMRVIRKDAFCAMTIFNVIISNATIQEIQSGAFSDRALIQNLEFVDVQLKNVDTAAFRAGHDNLTIQHSRFSEVNTGAINTSAATVTFNNNEFQHLKQGSIVLHQWNHIAIDRNVFVDLESDAIKAEVGATSAPKFEFSFTDNRIRKARPGSLRFAAISQSVNSARVGNNYFNEKCSCNLESWVRGVTGRNSSVAWMMDSSYCMVDNFLKKCLNLPEGYMAMRNFTQLICTQRDHVNCEKPSPKLEPSVSPPSVGPHIYPRQKGFFDMEMDESEQVSHEKRIIVIVCVVAVFVVVVVILASGILYMRRRGVCPKLISGSLMNLSNWLSSNNGMTAATSARSISRLSVHEYAGLQAETRILEMDTQTEGTEDDDEEGDVYPYTENKATQTLPEELTEEYLRDLQERLNDPDNHSQARDMIEHLYDLIKVEESCNNNNDRQPTGDREENAYDVIRPRIRRPRGAPKPSVNIGTRAPSLDKLLPSGMRIRPPITEYAQPRDQLGPPVKITDQNHLYAELPGDETVPSTSRLSQPMLESLIGRGPQPLPPDVVNDHLVGNDRPPRNLGYGADDCGPPQSPKLDTRNQSAKPMSFLKALGESIMGASASKTNNKRPNSLLCEYAEPSDTTHLYSELSEPQQTSASTSKMANRPLPTKPDQDSVAANAAKA